MKPTKRKIGALLLFITLVALICSPIGNSTYKYIRCKIGTEYPISFREGKFKEITIGMSEDEVLNLIGLPYGRLSWEKTHWNDHIKKFDYSMLYYKPLDWEHHFVKMIDIKDKKVVKITDFCNCE